MLLCLMKPGPTGLFYICFENDEILDMSKYTQLISKRSLTEQYFKDSFKKKYIKKIKVDVIRHLTVNDRFFVTLDQKSLMRQHKLHEFLIGTKFCFEYDRLTHMFVNNNTKGNITVVYAAVGSKLPKFDYRRLQTVRNIQSTTETISLHIWSYSYVTKKLKRPYKDKCINYRGYNLSSRFEAVIRCANDRSLNETGKLSGGTIIRKSDLKYNNMTFEPSINYQRTQIRICFKKYRDTDCDRTLKLNE